MICILGAIDFHRSKIIIRGMLHLEFQGLIFGGFWNFSRIFPKIYSNHPAKTSTWLGFNRSWRVYQKIWNYLTIFKNVNLPQWKSSPKKFMVKNKNKLVFNLDLFQNKKITLQRCFCFFCSTNWEHKVLKISTIKKRNYICLTNIYFIDMKCSLKQFQPKFVLSL